MKRATVVLAMLQSAGLSALFAGGVLTGGIPLIAEGEYTAGRALLIVITLTAGTAFIMWLGELITLRGVGNGMSSPKAPLARQVLPAVCAEPSARRTFRRLRPGRARRSSPGQRR